MSTVKEIATRYYEAGLSLVPIADDGTKKPPKGVLWKHRQSQLIKPNGEFEGVNNIAVLGGKISNVICIDFDLKYDATGTLWEKWKEIVNNTDLEILKKVLVQRTPSGGYHVVYKCSRIGGNTKLANNKKNEVLIETRGEGGYFLVAPSKGYELLQGDFTNIQTLTDEQNEIVITASCSFNEVFTEEPMPHVGKEFTSGESPFDDYNKNGDVEALLVSHGWVYKKNASGNRMYLRPGGTQEYSAGYHTEMRLFRVFTSSTAFEINKTYRPVSVYKILNGIKDGKELYKRLKEEGYGISAAKSIPEKKEENDFSKYIITVSDTEEYLASVRNGTFVVGESTGLPTLDDYFRLKRANFNIVNGTDGSGKSVVLWYLQLLSSKLYGYRHIIYSGENKGAFTQRKLIEFYWCKKIIDMTNNEYKEAYDFVMAHFTIINPEYLYSYKKLIDIADWLLGKGKYYSLLADPYNALSIDLTDNSKLNTHEYHYQAASEMRVFAKRNDLVWWLNCHAVTNALRQKDSHGYPSAPHKADTEGGGKFANRADDFLTIHRITQHPERWMETQIHVRKVKEIETGGQPTPQKEPVIIKMVRGFCGFEDINGYNPILKTTSTTEKNNYYEPTESYEAPF